MDKVPVTPDNIILSDRLRRQLAPIAAAQYKHYVSTGLAFGLFPWVAMLYRKEGWVIEGAVPVKVATGGCMHMSGLSKKSMMEALFKVAKKKAIPCGLARIGCYLGHGQLGSIGWTGIHVTGFLARNGGVLLTVGYSGSLQAHKFQGYRYSVDIFDPSPIPVCINGNEDEYLKIVDPNTVDVPRNRNKMFAEITDATKANRVRAVISENELKNVNDTNTQRILQSIGLFPAIDSERVKFPLRRMNSVKVTHGTTPRLVPCPPHLVRAMVDALPENLVVPTFRLNKNEKKLLQMFRGTLS